MLDQQFEREGRLPFAVSLAAKIREHYGTAHDAFLGFNNSRSGRMDTEEFRLGLQRLGMNVDYIQGSFGLAGSL